LVDSNSFIGSRPTWDRRQDQFERLIAGAKLKTFLEAD
jgi:hypothetical protein